jgi:hypothetical protein
VVTGSVPDLRSSDARHHATIARPKDRAAKPKPSDPAPLRPVATASPRSTARTATPPARSIPPPKARAARSRKHAASEAVPREFGFEQQAAAAEPAATTAGAGETQQPPPEPAQSDPTYQEFSPAEQEFEP